MTLFHISIFSAAAILFSVLAKGRLRNWLMLVGSVLAIYWVQSVTPIRTLDFWLPTATLALVVLVWALSWAGGDGKPDRKETLITAAALIGLVLIAGLLRYFGPLCCLTPSRPPQIWIVGIGLAVIVALVFGVERALAGKRWAVIGLIIGLLGLLIVLKTEPLAQLASAGIRSLMGQSVEQASAFDIRWLGFSYVAFRLVHVLLDWINGRLPAVSLQEFVIYVVFFPAFTAGPIDRVDRFVKDLRAEYTFTLTDLYEGGRRIVIGILKKFVLADGLALLALNGQNALQAESTGWLWVMLYAYAFRLYFDFAGYTDVAIGVGRLMGITLPENFERPYLKPNLTTFWNSWHMTLAQWFRAYWFNPVSRKMRTAKKWPVWAIILFGQITTMVMIGLWHGVTWNYAIWGAWHGIGLFVHNRWLNAMRARLRKLEERPSLKKAYDVLCVVFTFHFVLLGWIWFALPTVDMAGAVFAKLFGM